MNPSFHFTKMHGLGNDFIVINNLTEELSFEKALIQQLADRHTGIGFDQLLLIQPSHTADFYCRIFNADGSEAEQCGNGMRCVARFIIEEQLSQKNAFTLQTRAGITEALVHDFNRITVNMGVPRLEGDKIITLPSKSYTVSCLNLGNPHAVLKVDSLMGFPVSELGRDISTHVLFPNGVNVGFMEILHRKKIRLCTFERGSGETLACGSNSSAAVVIGIQQKLLDDKVTVELARGQLEVEWAGEGHGVFLTGPAETVFTGFYKK